MLVELPNKSTFFSPMQKDPINIREKLFQGIDKEYNVTNMGIVVEVLGELENFHMSREELELTRLGKHINELRRKASDKNLAGRAKSLIKKWRDLLSGNSDSTSGPGPGGGNNNNNSSLATNGNAGSRLNNSHVATTSPRLSSNQTPGTRDNNSRASNHPVTNNVSKQKVPNSPKLPPSRTPVSNHSPKPPHIKTPVSNVSPRAPQREPRAHQDARAPPTSQSARSVQSVRSVPPSPAKPTPPIVTVNNGSGSRDSPVVVSSGSSSPVSIVSVHSNSRPNSPSAAGSISIIKSREVSPQPHPQRSRTSSPANTLLNTGSKRFRSKDDSDPGPDAKHARLELHNGGGGASVPSSPNHLHDRPKNARRPRPRASLPVNSGYDLTKQMMNAKKKLRTTQELVSSLGIESRVQTSPAPVASVKDLVPNENKSELMDRFFSSQKTEDHGSEGEGGLASEPPSRPSTALEDATSSEASSKVNSRVNTPGLPKESVDDILSQLPPIDTAAILAELEKEIDEEEPEVDGLIPAFKPLKEITSSLVDELNNGQLEHIGGIKDHNGEFKEWHEMASVQSKDGELLHILPYSVID